MMHILMVHCQPASFLVKKAHTFVPMYSCTDVRTNHCDQPVRVLCHDVSETVQVRRKIYFHSLSKFWYFGNHDLDFSRLEKATCISTGSLLYIGCTQDAVEVQPAFQFNKSIFVFHLTLMILEILQYCQKYPQNLMLSTKNMTKFD